MCLRRILVMNRRSTAAYPTRSIFAELLKEMYLVGNRRGHYRAFLSLLRNAETGKTATKAYSSIKIPVLLLWGDRDWSLPDRREHDRQIVPAPMATVAKVGIFSPRQAHCGR